MEKEWMCYVMIPKICESISKACCFAEIRWIPPQITAVYFEGPQRLPMRPKSWWFRNPANRQLRLVVYPTTYVPSGRSTPIISV